MDRSPRPFPGPRRRHRRRCCTALGEWRFPGTAHRTRPSSRRNGTSGSVRLAQAYALTGNERHAEACLAAIEAWITEPPIGGDAAAASAADDGFRLISWCWALVLLRDSPGLTTLRLGVIADAIRQQASDLGADRTQWAAPATRVTVDALALFDVATLFPDFAESRRWRDLGRTCADRRMRTPGVPRRRALRAIHVLPALLDGRLSALSGARRHATALTCRRWWRSGCSGCSSSSWPSARPTERCRRSAIPTAAVCCR